jgi:hypothetical protein
MSNKEKTSSQFRKERNILRKNRDIDRQKKHKNYISEDFSISEGDFNKAKEGKFSFKNDDLTREVIEEEESCSLEVEEKKIDIDEELNNHDDEYEMQLQLMRMIELKKTKKN